MLTQEPANHIPQSEIGLRSYECTEIAQKCPDDRVAVYGSFQTRACNSTMADTVVRADIGAGCRGKNRHPHRPMPISRPSASVVTPRMSSLEQAHAFAALVHKRQKSEHLWLAQHPFVQAVRAGSATRHELERWVRQVYCITTTYGEILTSLRPPPRVGVWLDPWLEIDLLLQLGEALGIRRSEMAVADPNIHIRGIQLWLRQHLADPSLHVAGQVCWALHEAMSPEAGALLMEGANRHFGLKASQLEYFKSGMKSRKHADKYAATLLTQFARKDWASVQEQTLVISRLMEGLYSSVGDISSTW